MQRTTISLSDELFERVRRVAAERHTSIAALVREALQEKLRNHRPLPRSLGAGASGQTDTARRSSDERPVPRS